MASDEFCVLCGRAGRPLTDGVCADCAADRTPLVTVPEHAEVVVCPTCGARLAGRHWERAGTSELLTAEDLAPFLVVHADAGLRGVRWEEGKATGTIRELTGRARVRFRGIERDVPLAMSVRTVHRTCPECSRRSGRYYTAIVQLRGGADDRREKAIPRRERLAGIWEAIVRESRADWRAALSWREELPEGWDIYFTETLAARAVARLARQRFGASLTESASLFGRKDGRDVYRVTFCLRFPRGPDPPATGGRAAARPQQQ
ncbi:MAG TPA: 60S ribosomal export protein NMD3 [Thermoplasmata archaeon]|nr:60S ribosomal export protein NMD3 [Thermoplasmata archaeon]